MATDESAADLLRQRLFEDLDGFTSSRVLMAAINLNLFAALRDGPVAEAEIIRQLALHPTKGADFLSICSRVGYLSRDGDRYALTGVGRAVVEDYARFQAYVRERSFVYTDLLQLEQVVRSGENTTQTHAEWAYTKTQLERSDLPLEAVQSYSAHMASSSRFWARAFLDAVPLADLGSLLDVGGGSGSLAVEVARQYPQMRVGIFDLPAVSELAKGRIAEHGLAGRIGVHAGDFLGGALPVGYQAASLVRICWDWQDAEVSRLFSNIHRALPEGGTFLVAEGMYTGSVEADRQRARHAVRLLLMDGKLRSVDSLRDLLAGAGFRETRVLDTAVPGFKVLRSSK
jgi:demethylspheroidene O-methyltransferase